ncbi:Zn-ribbon domain-containing OB-fold protein [Haloterrigena alkaliphila]|uniref:OB-fold domain-containing protein n=1 Tax=Haloterrigena alkaliphila TaxID=2816475 RepID=A0A8A2VDG8_9EURY|nr:OB-fold domain-containing protein [Haloterrigena alkaliphila]QSW99276.1 OB-fold domain-containing protein [Haloterrigena alkaliphila]
MTGDADESASSATVEDRREEWKGPVPVPSGANTEFWAATLEGELLYQHCEECGTAQLYPRAVCTGCGAVDPPFERSEGVGSVYTYTVCHVPGEPGFGDRTPYVVAAVDLAEGPRLLALVDCAPDAIEVGDSLEVRFWQVSDEAAVPVFVPA